MKTLFFVVMLLSFVILASAQEVALAQANIAPDVTIASACNATAGTSGSVTYYNPEVQPRNNNFKLLGVVVKNAQGQADWRFMIDKSAMTAKPSQLIFAGSLVKFDDMGLWDNQEAMTQEMLWEFKSNNPGLMAEKRAGEE